MNGPESAPLRDFVKQYDIVVNFYNQDEELVRTEKLDYGDYEQKKWLGKLSYWAWELGYTVETIAAKFDK